MISAGNNAKRLSLVNHTTVKKENSFARNILIKAMYLVKINGGNKCFAGTISKTSLRNPTF